MGVRPPCPGVEARARSPRVRHSVAAHLSLRCLHEASCPAGRWTGAPPGAHDPAASPLPGTRVTLIAPHGRHVAPAMVAGWISGRHTTAECCVRSPLAARAGGVAGRERCPRGRCRPPPDLAGQRPLGVVRRAEHRRARRTRPRPHCRRPRERAVPPAVRPLPAALGRPRRAVVGTGAERGGGGRRGAGHRAGPRGALAAGRSGRGWHW